MKKITIFLLFAIAFPNVLFSQINYGIKGGLNYSIANWRSKNSEVQKNLNNQGSTRTYLENFHFGIHASKNLNKSFALQAELNYSREGFRFKDFFFQSSGKVIFHYLDLPILFSYSPIQKIKILVGPEIGYLISARTKIESSNFDVTDFYSNRLTLGGGCGLNFAITKKLEIEGRYIHGITSIRKTETFSLTNDTGEFLEDVKVKFKSRVFQISLKYFL